jgi:hypothetical protein
MLAGNRWNKWFFDALSAAHGQFGFRNFCCSQRVIGAGRRFDDLAAA